MSRYRSPLTVWSKKNGPMSDSFPRRPIQTVTFCRESLFSYTWEVEWLLSPRAYWRMLWVFREVLREKQASSPMSRFSRNRGGLARSQLENAMRRSWSLPTSSCLLIIWYGWYCKSSRVIRLKVLWNNWSPFLRDEILWLLFWPCFWPVARHWYFVHFAQIWAGLNALY